MNEEPDVAIEDHEDEADAYEGPDYLYEALGNWYVYMRDVAQYSKSSIKGKLQEATKLTNWLGNQDLISTREITAELVSAYMVENHAERADRTYNLYLSHLRMYIDFLRRKKLLGEDQNPEEDLIPRRRPESAKAKAFIYPQEILGLAEKAARWHDRDKYYLLFTFYMARRAGEICDLRWKDIDTTKRPGYPCGMFIFKNNKIGGDAKKKPIDPLLLPFIAEWRERYQELLNERFGFDEKGRPERKARPSDWVFPPVDIAPGKSIEGARRPLWIFPENQLSYSSVHKSLKKAGVFGIHSARRGGLIGLKERFGMEAARVMADHKTQAQTAEYMDEDREAENLGEMFAAEQAAQASEKAPEPVEIAGVTSLADRRARSRGTARGA